MKQFNAMTNVTSEVLLHDLSSPLIKLPEKDLGRENRKLLIISEALTVRKAFSHLAFPFIVI